MNTSKKLLGGAIAALFALLLGVLFLSPASAERAFAYTTGSLSDSVSWEFNEYEGSLLIYPNDRNSGSFDMPTDYLDNPAWPWIENTSIKQNLRSVRVESTVTVTDSTWGMFHACTNLEDVDLYGLDTSSVTDMRTMFAVCQSLEILYLARLDTSSAEQMAAMFAGCTSLRSLDIESFDTSSATNMMDFFAECGSLSSVVLGENFEFVDNLNGEPKGMLPDAPTDSPYTGRWSNGTVSMTAAVMADLTAPDLNGTWFWDDGSAPIYNPSPAPSYPTIPLTLTLEASKATNTAGMTFTFNPLQQPVAAEEEGAHAVPRWDSNDDGVIDSTDDYVLPQSTTLTALAMDGYTQDITGSLALPDPALYGHAGVYAYEVTQQIPVSTGTWDYSEASYKVRVYVVNGEDGLEYAETPITIESIEDDEGDPVAKTDGYGPKVARMLFTNVNTATTNLQVTKSVTGAYGNHAKEFPFTLTVNLPSWASDDSFAVTTTGTLLTGTTTDGAGDPIVTTASGTATITFRLAHGQSLSISGLPVGTTFSTSETDSTDGVNVYVPSATYRYDGASNTGDFATNTTNYAAALDSNSVPATNVTVNATAAAANASTMLGEGTGNLVTVTNNLSNPPSPTGIATAVLPYAIMIAIAAGALLVLRNRKRDDDLA